MLTPKQVQEITFVKAVFGGYDMKSVDDFLDQLSEDYIALYNENTNLKSKLRVLVQKLEEYRSKEESLNRAAAQAAAIVADAERKAAQTVSAAQPTQEQAQFHAAEVTAAIAAEEQRVENAKLVAQNFIQTVEDAVNKHVALLEELKQLDSAKQEKAKRPYDYEAEAEPEAAPAQPSAEDVAMEISQNIERFYAEDELFDPGETKIVPDPSAAKAAPTPHRFADLQFGPNYDPRG